MKLGSREHLDYCAQQQESCRIATSDESLTVMDRVGAQIGELDWMAAIEKEPETLRGMRSAGRGEIYGLLKRHGVSDWASLGDVLFDCASYGIGRMVSQINADLLAALKLMIEGQVIETLHAVHPSKRFCKYCGRNSEEHVHSKNCPVLIAEMAIAKAEGRGV